MTQNAPNIYRQLELEANYGGQEHHGRPQHGVDQDGRAGRPHGAKSSATGPKIPLREPVADAGGPSDADHADPDHQGVVLELASSSRDAETGPEGCRNHLSGPHSGD